LSTQPEQVHLAAGRASDHQSTLGHIQSAFPYVFLTLISVQEK
jgi:hypothetical protein